jgi:lipopolysaccharide/colanic/teichoic acid biosynthesis glycosyltransferase
MALPLPRPAAGRKYVLVEAEPVNRLAEFTRRAVNVAAALLLLVLTAPLMLLVALSVRLSSPGPILYTQYRVGVDRRRPASDRGHWRRRIDYGGRLFRIYKFRTMTVDTSAQQQWANPEDPRITRIGRILRQYRLDELPQLFNVLRGDMNLVGPRPEQPEIFRQLREKVDRYQERQRVLPGLTGWAQINQSYDSCLDDVRRKVELDLEYVERTSVTEDLRIILRTIPVVLFRRGGW